MSQTLSGRRVLLTGASSGIGRALAVRLAAAGARLAIVARRTELLDELAAEIDAAGPLVVSADLARPGVAAQVADRVIAEFGGVDVVVNNAGASLVGALSHHSDSDVARAVFETNVWSPLALAAAVVPSMRAQGHGTIVNVTSTIQSVPLPLLGYYASSKAALAQATRSLREELAGTPVRVLEVVPGGTNTALRDVGSLPWKASPPKMMRATSADRVAEAIVRALERGRRRLAYPSYVLVPLEIPAVGRLVARLGGRRIDSASALPVVD